RPCGREFKEKIAIPGRFPVFAGSPSPPGGRIRDSGRAFARRAAAGASDRDGPYTRVVGTIMPCRKGECKGKEVFLNPAARIEEKNSLATGPRGRSRKAVSFSGRLP